MCNPSHPNLRDIELGCPPEDLTTEIQPLIESTPSKNDGRRTNNDRRRRKHDPSPSDGHNADTGLGSRMLDRIPPMQQMVVLSFLMFLFFGMHNILQEAIVNLLSNSEAVREIDAAAGQGGSSLKSNGTFMLGYAEVVGVLLFSYLERVRMTQEGGFSRVAPLRAYPLLTLCLFASSSLSNLSLSYINFPTKVVFRSCKLVPTMIIATIVNGRVFKSYEYVCALSICAGLVLFAMADYKLDPLQYNPFGLFLVSGSVVADAILPNAQEHLFKDGSSRLEVTVFSNLFSFLGMTMVTLGNGTLFPFVRALGMDATLAMYFGVYTVLSYVSISCYMTLVKRFGGVTAVVLTTARKAMTLVLSFVLFPKGFSWLYVHGSLLVLGAVMVVSICKKLGGNTKKEQGNYKLQYRSDESKGVDARSVASTSSTCDSSTTISDESQLESSAEAIMEGISKRAYV